VLFQDSAGQPVCRVAFLLQVRCGPGLPSDAPTVTLTVPAAGARAHGVAAPLPAPPCGARAVPCRQRPLPSGKGRGARGVRGQRRRRRASERGRSRCLQTVAMGLAAVDPRARAHAHCLHTLGPKHAQAP
jgi:hypothetical protein